MAQGGGTFTLMNKKLPGSYINFVSADHSAPTLSDRGVVAFPFIWSWGPREIQVIHSEVAVKESRKYFGCDWLDPAMKPIREIFENARTLIFYRLNEGTKAGNTYAEALYGGERGNDVSIRIQTNVDEPNSYDVTTLVDGQIVDLQVAETMADLRPNDWVTWKDGAVLAVTAVTPLTGGEDGEAEGMAHQDFLDKIESYQFNALGVASDNTLVNGLYTNFTKRMRDEVGMKFQTVLYNTPADHEGIINLTTPASGDDEMGFIYWVTGAVGGCAINASNTNKKYTGSYEEAEMYTQIDLESSIEDGELVLHRVNDDLRILTDINSLTSTTLEKGPIFQNNQTVRVIDQIAIDIAQLFNTYYLGKVQNDEAGRLGLWSQIVQHHEQLQLMRAIEDFEGDDITVEPGTTKSSVIVHDKVTVVNSMEQLYMTVYVA